MLRCLLNFLVSSLAKSYNVSCLLQEISLGACDSAINAIICHKGTHQIIEETLPWSQVHPALIDQLP